MRKKKKKKRQQQAEVDKSPTRPPLSATHHENFQAKRLNDHPNINMGRGSNKRTAGRGGKSSILDRGGRRRSVRIYANRKNDPNSSDSDYSQTSSQSASNASESGTNARQLPTHGTDGHPADQENKCSTKEELQAKLNALQGLLNDKGKKPEKSGSESAMVKEVKKMAKETLWCGTKIVLNEDKLLEKTRLLMNSMEIMDFNGKSDIELASSKETWVHKHKDYVRVQINELRNYYCGQLRDLHKKDVFKKGELADSHVLVADSHPDLSFPFCRR